MGSMIDFARPDSGATKGYLATTSADRASVIVVQEWWGLNDQICGVADRFARAGYNALAPDLYEGRVTQEPDEAAHLMSGLDFSGATRQDLRGAARHLQGIGQKIGVVGFCMGGALTIASAVHVPEVAAGVCFYGIPPQEFADPAKIAIPLQCHFADQDDWCTPDAVNGLEAAMTAAGVNAQIHRYNAAHGFFNETSEANYDAAAANLAWERMTNYLATSL